MHLPVTAGAAGAVPKAKLNSLAIKIGVGSSLKFLSKKGPLARRLLAGERYSRDALMHELAERPGIDGIQLYSFNSLESLPAAGVTAALIDGCLGADCSSSTTADGCLWEAAGRRRGLSHDAEAIERQRSFSSRWAQCSRTHAPIRAVTQL
ncbi:hypothetical protein AAur_4001 [Paenarthrobacter aurescens TC1]|uniref:Uncharacterized protein n=1 Tax=Paenarthrobacter aurescens (strain TC1) TaxID=290340 RepID=A1RBR1_PAEAT|nr:hypothetical protein AAur_4001 [Paenarthrobacter aurescens TC1]